MGKCIEKLVPKEREQSKALLDEGKTVEKTLALIQKLPFEKRKTAQRALLQYLHAEALDHIEGKKKRGCRSEEDSKNILSAMEAQRKEPEFYEKVVRANSDITGKKKVFDKPFTQRLTKNHYPFIGIGKKIQCKFLGRTFLIMSYSAQIVENELRPDCNGIAVVHKKSGDIVIDCVLRTLSQAAGVDRDRLVSKQMREFSHMTDEDFRKFLFAHPLALEKYLWPPKRKKK